MKKGEAGLTASATEERSMSAEKRRKDYEANLTLMYKRADQTDHSEGKTAYVKYNRVMRDLAERFQTPLDLVTAAFVSLSPNNDYIGNLRSTVTVLHGVKNDWPVEQVTTSTYGHCKNRAYAYLKGEKLFLQETKGPKVKNFYWNLLDPRDPVAVTIDGHMVAAARDQELTMKEAIIRRKGEYEEIAEAARSLAKKEGLLPNQLQAIIWFARKRTLRIRYLPQMSLLHDRDDAWRTYQETSQMRPYPLRKPKGCPITSTCLEG